MYRCSCGFVSERSCSIRVDRFFCYATLALPCAAPALVACHALSASRYSGASRGGGLQAANTRARAHTARVATSVRYIMQACGVSDVSLTGDRTSNDGTRSFQAGPAAQRSFRGCAMAKPPRLLPWRRHNPVHDGAGSPREQRG